MFAGHVIVGNSLSITVTVKLHEYPLPEESVTLYDVVDTPKRKVEPGPEPETLVGVKVPSQLSEAVASTQDTTLLHRPVAELTIIFAGHANTGASLS